LIFSASCKKDEPAKVVHSGTSRIDYSVNNPLEMPIIEFTLSDT